MTRSTILLAFVILLGCSKQEHNEPKPIERMMEPPPVSSAQVPEEPKKTYTGHVLKETAYLPDCEIRLKSWKRLSDDDALVYNLASNSSYFYELIADIKNVSSQDISREGGQILVHHNSSVLRYDCVMPEYGWRLQALEKGEVVMIFKIPKEATGKMEWHPQNNPLDVYFIKDKPKQ